MRKEGWYGGMGEELKKERLLTLWLPPLLAQRLQCLPHHLERLKPLQTRCGVVWCGVVWWCVVWFVVGFGMVWCGGVWCGVVCCGGLVWWFVVWCVVPCGVWRVVWYALI